MRLYSTPQSALAGEVTVLAILETVAATSFSIWLVVHKGMLTHVVLGAAVAPFLLLRTDESTNLALGMVLRGMTRADVAPSRADHERAARRLLFIFLLARPISIAFVAIRRPLYSIKAVPQNWARTALAMDFFHPPEILPEIEVRSESSLKVLKFSRYWYECRAMFRHKLLGRSLFYILFYAGMTMTLVGLGILCYLPSLVYRYSLKATATVYLPILWIIHDSLVDYSSFKHKLDDIKNAPLEHLKRWYSWFVIVFLLLVPALVYLIKSEFWTSLSASLRSLHPSAAALFSAFLPTSPSGLHIAAWHIARGVNALLTLVLFQWAYSKLRQMERDPLFKADRSVALLNLWLLIRGLLTLYIIGCTLYIVISAATWKDFWPVHIKWFPWNK